MKKTKFTFLRNIVNCFVEKKYKRGKLKREKQYPSKVSKDKFTEYALNPMKSPEKAMAFEKALGYTIEDSDVLADQIKTAFDPNKLIKKGDSGYGMKYEQIMSIKGKKEKKANVMTAWIQEKNCIRLISVYITKKKVNENENTSI